MTAQEQYFAMKDTYTDTLLIFRQGGTYELYEDDARQAARVLCGDPVTEGLACDVNGVVIVEHRNLEVVLANLIAAGLRAAVCEQVPPSQGK